ncbi:MAG TPA: hypothetical protein VGB08_06080 [Allosphingosinicella sp.]
MPRSVTSTPIRATALRSRPASTHSSSPVAMTLVPHSSTLLRSAFA